LRLNLPRETRLVRRSEYDAVYREGRRRSSREFTVFLRPNGLDISRFGWSIKKALGNAVRRNRIRRRLREILRLHRQEIAPGWDMVIHPRSSAATAEFLALTQELLKAMPSRAKTLE
jgi:ribonuclease P protein component